MVKKKKGKKKMTKRKGKSKGKGKVKKKKRLKRDGGRPKAPPKGLKFITAESVKNVLKHSESLNTLLKENTLNELSRVLTDGMKKSSLPLPKLEEGEPVFTFEAKEPTLSTLRKGPKDYKKLEKFKEFCDEKGIELYMIEDRFNRMEKVTVGIRNFSPFRQKQIKPIKIMKPKPVKKAPEVVERAPEVVEKEDLLREVKREVEAPAAAEVPKVKYKRGTASLSLDRTVGGITSISLKMKVGGEKIPLMSLGFEDNITNMEDSEVIDMVKNYIEKQGYVIEETRQKIEKIGTFARKSKLTGAEYHIRSKKPM